MLQKACLEAVHILLLRRRVALREQHAHNLLQQADHRCERNHRRQTEERVHQRDAHGRHRRAEERKMHHRVHAVENAAPDHNAQYVDQQIHKRRALAVDVRPQRRQQHRHGRADGDAHHDRQRHAEGNRPRDRERLQNADRGRSALQHAREHKTDEDAEQGVGKRREHLNERLALAQGRDGAAHRAHAVHQNREAEQNVAHMAGTLPLGEHAQNDADHRDDARERRGAQQLHPATPAGEIRQADDPARDARAEDRAEHDADGLTYLHHAGVDKAHHHHRRGGRGLDHGGHAGAQQNSSDRGAAELIENQLELIARHPFQSVAHQAHTEQEQGNAAQKCDTVRNRHTRISSHFKLLYYYTGKSSICRWVSQNCSVNL